MKQLFLFVSIIFQTAIAFSQQYTSSNPQFKWGAWVQDNCFKGIYIRSQKAYFNKGANQWYWNWQIQNRYNNKVAVSWVFYDKNEGKPEYTKKRHTFEVNETLSNGAFGSETELSWFLDKICFKFKLVNGTELDDCSTDPSIYKTGFYYAECDNGLPRYKAYVNRQQSSSNAPVNSTSGSNSSTTNTATDDDVNALNQKRMELCSRIMRKDPNNIICNNWAGGDASRYASASNAQKILLLKEDIRKLEQLDNAQSEADRKQQAAEEAHRQKLSAEKEAFDNYLQQGDAAMSSQNYDAAMGYYNQAKSSTSDASMQSQAQAKYNAAYEAKRQKLRSTQIQQAKDRDKTEDATYTTTAIAAVGAMGLLKDSYSYKGAAIKFQLGLGFEQSPILSYNTSTYNTSKSYIEKRNLATFHTGLTLVFLNKLPVSIYLKPRFNFGMSAFATGTSGGFISYGGYGGLQLGYKRHSPVSLYAEGGWMGYDGRFAYDAGVTQGTGSNDVREGTMNYKTISYGGGIMLRIVNDDNKESYLRPGVLFEKPSFFTTAVKPVLSMRLELNICSEILLAATYTPNTYIPGELKYPSTLERKNVNYIGVQIIRQGKLL